MCVLSQIMIAKGKPDKTTVNSVAVLYCACGGEALSQTEHVLGGWRGREAGRQRLVACQRQTSAPPGSFLMLRCMQKMRELIGEQKSEQYLLKSIANNLYGHQGWIPVLSGSLSVCSLSFWSIQGSFLLFLLFYFYPTSPLQSSELISY